MGPPEWEQWILAFWVNFATAIPCFLLCVLAQVRWYPQFLRIHPSEFPSAHARHCRRLGWLAPLPFLADLLAAGWLAWLGWSHYYPFLHFTRYLGHLTVACVAMTLLGWASTFLLVVPLHRRLESGFDEGTVRTLIRLNAVRTAVWALKIPASLLFWRA